MSPGSGSLRQRAMFKASITISVLKLLLAIDQPTTLLEEEASNTKASYSHPSQSFF
jgi:hypothetical protein